MSNQQLAQREAAVADAFELEVIRNQVADLLGNDKKKMGSFKTKLLSMAMNPMLKKCTPESIINCGLQALTLDLPLQSGQGYIVAYKGVAQIDIGYKGFQVLAKRSGFSVIADAVYNCDFFEQSGFGFNAQMTFEPNHAERKPADDSWVKKNIKGVIVSIREDATKVDTVKWVPADVLWKIVGMSPSKGSDYSPHNNWTENMLLAKGIKSVISKMPIDISKASTLNDAIQIVNNTEASAQAQPQGKPEYSQSRFDEMWPKWVERVESGKTKAVTIITQLSNGFTLSEGQMTKVQTLGDHEPIDGETVDADATSVTTADGRLAREAEAEKDTYNDADFKKLYKLWQISIEKGESTVDGLIENIQKTHKITDAQMSSLQGLHDAAPIAQEA